MIKSGMTVKAMRPPQRGGPSSWVDCDLCDLSTEEFLNWWKTIETDEERFYVAETLRRLSHNLSDFGDSEPP